MFRTLAFASLAVAALGLTGLSPTSAEAKGFKHHHHHHKHHGHVHGHRHGHWSGAYFAFGSPVYLGPGCYVSRRVSTPWGPRWHVVNRCY